jgi:RNA polymerase sigma-70 factor (ECF subfamily)
MNDAAFQKLVLTEVESVHRLAYHLCRNLHEAEDLVQETYLHALGAAHSYQPHEHGARPWLFKILHNALHTRRARDRRARESLRRLRDREPVDETKVGEGYPSVDGGGLGGVHPNELSINWEDMDERLYEAIRLLPVAHRTVFLLAAVEDFKYREIAEVVGIPVGTVMSRLSRARTVLAGQLRDLAAERNLRASRAPVERQEAPAVQKEP